MAGSGAISNLPYTLYWKKRRKKYKKTGTQGWKTRSGYSNKLSIVAQEEEKK